MLPDHYKTLGVHSFATQEEIKKAYRRLSRGFHPDLHGNSKEANERFQKIIEAYYVLSNPTERDEYDRTINPSSNPLLDLESDLIRASMNFLKKVKSYTNPDVTTSDLEQKL